MNDLADIKLLPCGFCSGPARVAGRYHDSSGGFGVICDHLDGCYLDYHDWGPFHETPEEAAALWNWRSPAT